MVCVPTEKPYKEAMVKVNKKMTIGKCVKFVQCLKPRQLSTKFEGAIFQVNVSLIHLTHFMLLVSFYTP